MAIGRAAALAALVLMTTAVPAAAEDVGARAKRGHPEYLFLETMGKQAVYRHMEPIRLVPPCLGCHGKPKGAPDMLGYEKDGLDAGDVIGLMSVTLAVSD